MMQHLFTYRYDRCSLGQSVERPHNGTAKTGQMDEQGY